MWKQLSNPVGFEFRPTDEELVDYYLRLKNLGADTSHVDQVINTVNICSFDPWDLPSKSRIMRPIDQVWYFFGPKENKYNKGDRQSRKTKTGFWKKTGVTLDITRKRGTREKIGEKKVLVFHLTKIPNGSKSTWVMHEYHATFLPPNQMITYTVCKVEFKGEERDISSSSGSEIEISRSLIPPMNNNSGGSGGSSFECLTSQELQISPQFSGPLDMDALDMTFKNLLEDDWKSLYDDDDDDEQRMIVSMQEDRNDYRPKKSLTGVFIGHGSDDSDSDSDSTSATTSFFQTSSTCGSFGSSNRRIDKITDLQKSPNSTTQLVPLAQKVSQALAQGTEIGEHNLGQEIITKKRNSFFYRIIQRFVKKLDLCSPISRT